jgi:anti-anti-sigma factor
MPRQSRLNERPSTTIFSTSACETSVEVVQGRAVVRVSGELSAASLVPFRRALDTALRPRPSAVVLDLHGVADAGAVVPVLGLLRRYVERRGVAFCLVAHPAVTRALATAGVIDLYRVVPSVVEAVECCSSPPASTRHRPARAG